MRAFVVRPFAVKNGVDFERVHEELIVPALAAVGIEGDTTKEIAQAGNIRTDMFKLLSAADLVIADLSIHNANVFYELGVRHAVRGRGTYLIRAKVDDVPFDLLTDRYLQYDPANPGASVDALARGLRATMDSEDVDSPVIGLLKQELIVPDMTRLLEPPAEFREEVHRALQERRGGDLSLLSEESTRLVWAREGLRRVGTAQFELASYEGARLTWEGVREYDRNDLEANGRLATIYQKVGELNKADEAVDRVLQNADVRGPERAELQSLRGSNCKTRWMAEWSNIDDAGQRAERALKSPWLRRAYEDYWAAFEHDRNHYYSGLNALALVVVLLELGERLPAVWADGFDTDEQARAERDTLTRRRQQLEAAVDLSLQSAVRLATFTGRPDKWLEISQADLAFLTGLGPNRVATRYRGVLADAQPFHLSTARRQLVIYTALDVRQEAAAAGIAAIDQVAQAIPAGAPASQSAARVIVFTGHRIDAPGRQRKRFPGTAEAEALARALIEKAVEEERAKAGGEVIGIAGGASGSDILFHEICASKDIKTQLYIVGSRDAYVTNSVNDGGPRWVERFDKLCRSLPTRVLGDSQSSVDLPRWLRPAKNYSVWERNNRWILNNALVHGASKTTLVALWDGERGDGPGGTGDMVETARARGAKVSILDAKPLANL